MVEPDTRPSLMLRLRAPQDQQAWAEFVSIYEPLVMRVLRQRGLQHSDARDVTQQVILAVTQAVQRWQPDGQRASFRRWLFSIARRLAIRFLERGQPKRGVGGSDMLKVLDRLPEPEHRTKALFDDEYRNEVFRWAADQIKTEFRESTWQAFWRTCVLNEPIPHVAELLGMSLGNVYVARSRIIARLRIVVEQFEAEHGSTAEE
ncbi:MAG: sigma-70 family RNA polymerase sigma factor [Planctomycetes bacterium]|nr:sigma-70 family RNA polymerase sigma factor [Planctomycetota bacterium]